MLKHKALEMNKCGKHIHTHMHQESSQTMEAWFIERLSLRYQGSVPTRQGIQRGADNHTTGGVPIDLMGQLMSHEGDNLLAIEDGQ